MAERNEYPLYDVALTASEICHIKHAIEEMLHQLATQRMILLDNEKMASYEAMVKQTVDYERLLNKIRRKEL